MLLGSCYSLCFKGDSSRDKTKKAAEKYDRGIPLGFVRYRYVAVKQAGKKNMLAFVVLYS